MAKINRISGDFQAFGSAAVGTERTVFGGVTQSDIIDDNITANFLRGWGIVGVNENPTKQDFNALGFTLSQVLAYLHQQGVASWDALQEYNLDAITTKAGVIYISQSDSNIGNDPVTDSGANWLSVTVRQQSTLAQAIAGNDTTTDMSPAAVKQAIVALGSKGLGDGQTWQDVTASRAAGVTYTNTTGRSIFVSITEGTDVLATLHVDGIRVSYKVGVSNDTNLCAIVPNGSTYIFSGGNAYGWTELR